MPLFELAVLPAYAGMIPGTQSAGARQTGAPRVCGDDPRHREHDCVRS